MKKLSILIVVIVFSFVSFSFVHGYGFPVQELNEKIEEVITQLVKLDHFSGSVLVAKEGKILFAKAYGEANKDHHVKNTLKTKFNIGSITKTFTGVAIMQLAEKGKLKLEDPVVNYLEDFPYGNSITIFHLLTHTSGIKDYHQHPTIRSSWYRIRNISDVIPMIYGQKLEFDTPGEKFSYSSSEVVLLGAIIEKVTGNSFENYITENILLPVGMHYTEISCLADVVKNRATGYVKSSTGLFKTAEKT